MRRKMLLAVLLLCFVFVAVLVIWFAQANAAQKESKEEISSASVCVLEQNKVSTRLDKKQLAAAKSLLLGSWKLDLFYRETGAASLYVVLNNVTVGVSAERGRTYLKILDKPGKHFYVEGSVYARLEGMMEKQEKMQAADFEVVDLPRAEADELWNQLLWNAYLALPPFENVTQLYSAQLLHLVYDRLLTEEKHAVFFEEKEQNPADVTIYLPVEQVREKLGAMMNISDLPEDGTVYRERYNGKECYTLYGQELPSLRKEKLKKAGERPSLVFREFRGRGESLVAIAKKLDDAGNKEIGTVYFSLVKRADQTVYLSKMTEVLEIPEGISATGDARSVGTIASLPFPALSGGEKTIQLGKWMVLTVDDGYKMRVGAVDSESGMTKEGIAIDFQPGEAMLRWEKRGEFGAILTNQRVLLVSEALQVVQMIHLPKEIGRQYDLDPALKNLIYIDGDGLWSYALESDLKTQIYKQPYQYDAGNGHITLETPRFVDKGQRILCHQMLDGQELGYYLFDEEGQEELFKLPHNSRDRDVELLTDRMVMVLSRETGQGELIEFANGNRMGFSLSLEGLVPGSITANEAYLAFFSEMGHGAVLKIAKIHGSDVGYAKNTDFGVSNARVRLYGLAKNGNVLCGYGNLGKNDILLTKH